jgi:hypothetical protein
MAPRRIRLYSLIVLSLAGLLTAFGAMQTVNPGPPPAAIQAADPTSVPARAKTANQTSVPAELCGDRVARAGPRALSSRLHDVVASQPRTLALPEDYAEISGRTFDACGLSVEAQAIEVAGPTTLTVDAGGSIGSAEAYRVATGPLAGRWIYAADWLTIVQPSPTAEPTAVPAPTARPSAQPSTAAKPRSTSTAPKPMSTSKAAPAYRGRNHIWIPSLGLSRHVYVWGCRSGTLPNRIYQWTCAGKHNLDLLGHAWGVLAPMHDFYVSHKRMPRNAFLMYADGSGKVRRYDLAWTRVVSDASLQNGKDQGIIYDDLARPSITLETCIGANNVNRLVTRWVLSR